MSAIEIHKKIKDGQVSAVEVAKATLDHIQKTDGGIHAWAFMDEKMVMAQAEAADKEKMRGKSLGPLHGVPVGIKDIIDVAHMPCKRGTKIYESRRPVDDAMVISLLRQAGAIIIGKTVTTEMAVYSPGKTKNPHNPNHTPGGSSSGSAAAVAANHVPLALGTQTNGSIIRPASFCGVYGFKPTFGLVSRHRILKQSPSMDTVGFFSNSLDDLALIADCCMTYDARDDAMQLFAPMGMAETLTSPPPLPPKFAFVRGPHWEDAHDTTKAAFQEVLEVLGDRVDILDLPFLFDESTQYHRMIMEADLSISFANELESDLLSDELKTMLQRGKGVTAHDYLTAMNMKKEMNGFIDQVIEDYDAIITPSTPSTAPKGLESTGSPKFSTLWTYLGLPSVSLPLLQGENDLPLGIQLVSSMYDDARLLRNARLLSEMLQA